MILSSKIALVIFGLCHGAPECIENVKDLYPKSKEEAVHAYQHLYGEQKCDPLTRDILFNKASVVAELFKPYTPTEMEALAELKAALTAIEKE